MAQAHTQGRLPIFVGGTGLYFKALTQGISDMPRVPEAVRAEWRARAETMPVAALHAELAARDPLMAARLKPSDPQRILRALEVHTATGRASPFSRPKKASHCSIWKVARRFSWRRSARRCAPRSTAASRRLLESGALDEVAALGERGLDPALPVMRALGRAAASAPSRGRERSRHRDRICQARHARLCQTAIHFRAASIAAVPMGEPGGGRGGAGRVVLGKISRQIPERGWARVLVGEDGATLCDGPGNIERRIVPGEAKVMPAGIIRRHLVEHFAIGFERAEAMREAAGTQSCVQFSALRIAETNLP